MAGDGIIRNENTQFSNVDITSEATIFGTSSMPAGLYWIAGTITGLDSSGTTLTLKCYKNAKVKEEYLDSLVIDTTQRTSKQNIQFIFPQPFFLSAITQIVITAHSTNGNDIDVSGYVYLLTPFGSGFAVDGEPNVNVVELNENAIQISGDGYQEIDAVKVNGAAPMGVADIRQEMDANSVKLYQLWMDSGGGWCP